MADDMNEQTPAPSTMDPGPDDEKLIPRERPDVRDGRKQFVEGWATKVKRAKKHWSEDFKRIRSDLDFAYLCEKQWDGVPEGEKYVANIVQRHIGQRVAALYAKNPKAIARMRERLCYRLWDGDTMTLQNAQMVLMQSQEMGLEPPPDAIALLQDYQEGQVRKDQYRRIAKTLELTYGYYVDEQAVPFKGQMKQLVRRTVACGIGYLKLGYQRVMQRRPEIENQIADLSAQLSMVERVSADLADGKIEQDDPQVEQMRLTLQRLENEPQVLVREGLVFDFPFPTQIIPAPECRQLKGFVGAPWVAEEYCLTLAQVQEIYGVDVGQAFRAYKRNDNGEPVVGTNDQGALTIGGDGDGKDPSEKMAVVWEVYSKSDGLVYTICDGYPDFLVEPSAPDVFTERFWPWFTLSFNDVEHEKRIYPLSDTTLLRPIQKEYNRARDGLREHRRAARPKTVSAAGQLDDEDKENLMAHPANAIIELNALQPGQSVDALLQPFKGPPIDPNLYETSYMFDDVLRVVGAQEANLGGTSGSTATETSIAESSRMSSLGSAVDELDDFLTEVARTAGQVLLSEVAQETVKKIVGPGAVWPELSREDIVDEVYLEIEAGSSGRPNKVQELQNLERVLPYLIQIPGISPEWLAREVLRRMDDRLDLAEAIDNAMPAITAMNQQTQPGTGDPETDPNQQGAEGGQKARSGAESEQQPPRTPGASVEGPSQS